MSREPITSAKFRVSRYDPNRSMPIVFGMHYPGIVMCWGTAYNDESVKPPCYRVADDPRVGFQTAKWVESE
jgi:hypothetical protein